MGSSSCGSWALEHRLSSCGEWAQLPHGIWIFPDRGQTCVPCVDRQILYHCDTREALNVNFKQAIFVLKKSKLAFLFNLTIVSLRILLLHKLLLFLFELQLIYNIMLISDVQGLHGDPVVKNLPANAGDSGLIPGLGTKILHVTGQVNLRSPTTEAHVLQGPCFPTREATAVGSPPTATKTSTTKNKNKSIKIHFRCIAKYFSYIYSF